MRPSSASGSPTGWSTGSPSTSRASSRRSAMRPAMHAPGKQLMFDATPVAHHLLLAHGRAAIAFRAAGATSVGCANNHAPVWPASDDDADVGASKLFDAFWNGMYIEPMLLGRYPIDLAPLLEDVIYDGDLATIRQPLDFYGVNYYTPIRIGADRRGSTDAVRVPRGGRLPDDRPHWSVVPDALREWLIMFRARLARRRTSDLRHRVRLRLRRGPRRGRRCRRPGADRLPRGAPDRGRRGDADGRRRPRLLRVVAHGQLRVAAGYRARFGLVHVDHETQPRTKKRSFEWYADLVAATAPATTDRRWSRTVAPAISLIHEVALATVSRPPRPVVKPAPSPSGARSR